MVRFRSGRAAFVLALGMGLLCGGPARPQIQAKKSPQAEPVAETRLLMEGINLPNYQGLERLLREKPADIESWTFARGQALLIAENGNLLLLRPPRTQGREIWLDRSAGLREAATRLARSVANRDYEHSRAALTDLANACNRCHQAFRVDARFTPFKEAPKEPER